MRIHRMLFNFFAKYQTLCRFLSLRRSPLHRQHVKSCRYDIGQPPLNTMPLNAEQAALSKTKLEAEILER